MLNLIEKQIKKIELNKYKSIINKIEKENDIYKDYSNEDLKKEFLELKNKKDELKGLSLSKELSKRFFNLTPYKTQLTASLVLKSGYISEQGTGEGKTLSVVLAILLNYLDGKNAHIVTANDYLVLRDFNFSKPLFDFLGITSSFLYDYQSFEEKKQVYKSDVVYSVSKNLVFDYLHYNRIKAKDMLFSERKDLVIIDEIDFVLIDEARTPIILSGLLNTDKDLYIRFQEYQKDFSGITKEEMKTTSEEKDFIYTSESLELTEKGFSLLESKLIKDNLISKKEDLYEGVGFIYIKHLEKALRANYLLLEDVHYLKNDNQIILINPQTGRPQPGKRFSSGNHQALEAKEGLEIQHDAKTLAQTTLQNFFKKYDKISGTTGTAQTEETEFKEFYNLRVLPIEPNRPLQRIDANDLLFLTESARINALVEDVKDNQKNGRPTLIGTLSVSSSEIIAKRFTVEGIHFELLNAKNHEREAHIIANAGKKGAVTIATNMAGRGTDIMLGGNKAETIQEILTQNEDLTEVEAENQWLEDNKEVIEAGGLSVIGIGRSSSRRLDNQLIGRCGRQGDPGFTKFYLTLDDDLFVNASTNLLRSQWTKENANDGLSMPILTKIIRESQKAYEGSSFQMRKTLLKFDNINSEQREIFYDWRKKVVFSEDFSNLIIKYMTDVISKIITSNLENEDFFANDLSKIEKDFEKDLSLSLKIKEVMKKEDLVDEDDLLDYIKKILIDGYNEKMSVLSDSDKIRIEKEILLDVMDENFSENISNLESMRTNAGLRAYAQKNPIDEYQKEALEMFSNLVIDIKKDFCALLIGFSPLSLLQQKEKMKEMQEELEKEKEISKKQSSKNLDVNEISRSLPKYTEGIGI